MADTVRYLLEEMIPEVEELEKKGYFSRSEIKQIIQKRQDFEYHLKRRAALKQDFLRYVDYEVRLEELRKHRKAKFAIKGKKGLAEVGILRRVHFIYDRATRKFKSDLSLWMQWIDYCKKSHSTKQLSKVVTKALKRHGTVTALWVEAAAWEFEHSANVAAARSLMQQGLRMCKHDEAMWAEYFRMELLYVHKLRARREVLGLSNPDSSDVAGTSGREESATPEAAGAELLTGAVARVVAKHALASLPSSLTLCKRLLAVLKPFTFPGTKELEEFIYSNMQANFATLEEAWDLVARRHSSCPAASSGSTDDAMEEDEPPSTSGRFDEANHSKCVAVYQEALQRLPTARMYLLFGQYLADVLTPLLAATQRAGQPPDQSFLEALALVGAELLAAMQAAHTAGSASEELYAYWVDWALKLSQEKVAVKAARKACEQYPSSGAVWRRRLALELELRGRKQHSSSELFETLRAGLLAVPVKEAEDLWMQALEALTPGNQDFKQLVDALALVLAGSVRGPPSGGMGKVAAAYLEKIRSSQGIEAARAFYKRLRSGPSPGGDFYRAVIAMEEEAVGSTSAAASATAHIRQLYELAVDAYGADDAELWLSYAVFEQRHMKGVGSIYWRATKVLQDVDEFITKYRELVGAVH